MIPNSTGYIIQNAQYYPVANISNPSFATWPSHDQTSSTTVPSNVLIKLNYN